MRKRKVTKSPRLREMAKELFTKGYVGRAQQRAKRRKSAWNLILIPLGFSFMFVFTYAFFQFTWWVHTLFFPEHIGEMREFFRQKMTLSGILLLFPNFFASIPFGLMGANLVAWCIPPARRAFDREAEGVKWASFSEAMSGLFRISLWFLAICLLLALIGAATLSEIK